MHQLLCAFLLLFSFPVWSATVSNISVSGSTASNVLVISSSSGTTSTTTPTSNEYRIYAGDAGKCPTTVTKSDSSTCDSCASVTSIAGNGRTSCNNRNIHSNLYLYIGFTVDSVPSGGIIKYKIGNNSAVTPTAGTYATANPQANTQLFIRMKWSDLITAGCALSSSNCTTDSSDGNELTKYGGFSDMSVTFGVTGSADDTFSPGATIKIYYRGVSPSREQFYTDCATSSPADSYDGFCSFSLSPGDEKVYIENTATSGIGPESSLSIYWGAMRFYRNQTGTFNPSVDAYTDIPVSVNTSTSEVTPLDSKIIDLQNDVTYSFLMASVDQANNVVRFGDPSSTTYVKTETPQAVVGLLDGKKCFVATAAFGSEMDSHVDSLRRFRNEFLLGNTWGRSFVKFYYKHSPAYARVIAQNETLRTAARWALWPAVIFSDLAQKFGIWGALSVVFIVIGISYVFILRAFSQLSTLIFSQKRLT